MPQVFSPARVAALTERARADYIAQRPRSAALAAGSGHLLSGVPMHWMRDWGTPFPLYIDHAQGAQCVDVDGHVYTDFCLGDTGAMFGHSPAPVAAAIAERAARGYSCMLPGADANWVGAHLAERFGLPVWQIATTATDANRFVLRCARCLPAIACPGASPKSARAANSSFAPPRRAPAPRRKQPWTTRWSACST